MVKSVSTQSRLKPNYDGIVNLRRSDTQINPKAGRVLVRHDEIDLDVPACLNRSQIRSTTELGTPSSVVLRIWGTADFAVTRFDPPGDRPFAAVHQVDAPIIFFRRRPRWASPPAWRRHCAAAPQAQQRVPAVFFSLFRSPRVGAKTTTTVSNRLARVRWRQKDHVCFKPFEFSRAVSTCSRLYKRVHPFSRDPPAMIALPVTSSPSSRPPSLSPICEPFPSFADPADPFPAVPPRP